MTSFGEFKIKAAQENVRIILQLLHGIGEHLQFSEKMQFDVELALEEAIVNIVNHAYPSDEKGDVVVQIDTEDDVFVVTLCDWGVIFDEATAKSYDINEIIESRIEGGMGLHFMNTLMDEVLRSPRTDMQQPNVLTLKKKIERLKTDAHPPSVTRELNAVLDISRILSTGIDLDTLLARIVEELVSTIGAERGTLYLVDREHNELFSRVLSKDTGNIQEIRVAIGQGIAGEVAETGKVLNIKDAYEYEKFSPEFDKATGFVTHSILAAPMLNHHQEIIGVVQLLNKHEGVFTNHDIRLVTAMASQAAISIENSRLYRQEIEQQLFQQELTTAKSIQTAFLPQRTPRHDDWDIAFYWEPMRDVGGDFYDFYRLPDGRWAFVIADVSGKGVPAAMFMAYSVTVLRFAMSVDFEPAELLYRANQVTIEEQHSTMFATVFVAYFDLGTGEFTYSSAGHNPPILYRAKMGECEFLEVSGVAMGLFTSAVFEDFKDRMEPDDMLVLYTDGFTEVFDEDEEEFGEEGLEALIKANAHLSAQEMIRKVIETVYTYNISEGSPDDQTLVVIKKK